MFNLSAPTLARLMWLPGLVLGFTVHELAHALTAYWMGDRGDLTRERLTLNPLKHVHWLGLGAFLVLGLGWAKPVRFRPGAFRHANLGSLLVSLAGVTTNALVVAVFFIITLAVGLGGMIAAVLVGADGDALINIVSAADRLTPLGALVGSLTGSMVDVNIALALFNLIPVPGFDGFHALLSLGRLVVRYKWSEEECKQTQASVAFEEGNRLARTGQVAQAVEAWRRAILLCPSFYGALHNLGLAYSQAGQRSAALGALANARLAASTEDERQRVSGLLKQIRWDSDEPPSPVTIGTLPRVPVIPMSPDEEASAGRRRVFKIVGIAMGTVVGLVAYMALMMFLALVAAGPKV